MAVEELLKPRIKMIAPIPKIFSCGIEVGDIWEGEEVDEFIIFNLTGAHRIDLGVAKKYPHLFKILDWWEDRKEEDMPEYVKWGTPDKEWVWVAKILELNGDCFRGQFKDGSTIRGQFTANQDYPATKEDFESQTK